MPCRHVGKSVLRILHCGAAYHGSRTKAQVWACLVESGVAEMQEDY